MNHGCVDFDVQYAAGMRMRIKVLMWASEAPEVIEDEC